MVRNRIGGSSTIASPSRPTSTGWPEHTSKVDVGPLQPVRWTPPAAAVGLLLGEPCRALGGPELGGDDAEGAGVDAPP
jgi:hypothetical protein